MASIGYTERPILALSLTREASAGLIWAEFNFMMSQQAPICRALNSWAARANDGHPIVQWLDRLIHQVWALRAKMTALFRLSQNKPSFSIQSQTQFPTP